MSTPAKIPNLLEDGPQGMLSDSFLACVDLLRDGIEGCGEPEAHLDFLLPPGKRTMQLWLEEASYDRLYLWPLAASTWRRNIQHLNHCLSERRHEALSRPGMNTYVPLVELRRTIARVRETLLEAVDGSKRSLRQVEHRFDGEAQNGMKLAVPAFSHLLNELNKLDRELNDEIHLIIGAVTVQDSAFMKEQTVRMEQQAERATLLTFLAAIYLPLTLVTGIFGMNIKEIDQGAPTFRACLAALGIAAVCTILLVLCYRYRKSWERLLSRRKDRVDEEAFKAA